MTVKVKKLSETAHLPQKAHKSDAGYDLVVSRITTELNEVGELIIVYHTDLSMEIPEGYFGLLIPRSSVAKKPLMAVASSAIDAGYRGEIVYKFRHTVPAIIPTLYKPGERFAQLIISPVPEVEMVESDTLGASDRGEAGLGSTGDAAFTQQDEQHTESAPMPMQEQDSANDTKVSDTSAEATVSTNEEAAGLANDPEEA